jgi:predicted metal-dependent peptidase
MLEERRVKKAKISLMRSERFALLSGVLMVGTTRVDETTPTAKTDGRNEVYGRAFVAKLRDTELAFLIAHEAGHKMYRHLSTWRKLYDEDHGLANQACDYVINLMLTNLDPNGLVIAMPVHREGPMIGRPIGLIDARFTGMNSKQVFDILKQEKKDKGEGGDGEGDGGLDDHDWDGAKDMTEEDKKALERDLDQAVRQGLMAQKRAGKGAGGTDRELEELMEPRVNWREVLREFVKSTCRAKDASSWRRPNRRHLSTGLYMPSLIGEKVGHIVIAVDTSGSIGGKEIAEFLSEVKGVAEEVNPEIVDLIYWDSEVAGHETYESSAVASMVESTKPRGGGGTSPSCVSEYLKDKNIKPECIVVLTDGYVGNDWGSEWTAPVLWAIVGGGDMVAEHGKTIHVKE